MPRVAGLSPKQRAFVDEYLIDLNATQAAIRAGYSPKRADAMGYENLRKPEIQAAVSAAKAKRAERLELTAEYVVAALHDVEQRCRQAVEVLDKDGNPTGEWRFDASGANKALELIGRHIGMFRDRVEHTGNVFGLVINAGPPEKKDPPPDGE
jgi:phage terminase small subunit